VQVFVNNSQNHRSCTTSWFDPNARELTVTVNLKNAPLLAGQSNGVRVVTAECQRQCYRQSGYRCGSTYYTCVAKKDSRSFTQLLPGFQITQSATGRSSHVRASRVTMRLGCKEPKAISNLKRTLLPRRFKLHVRISRPAHRSSKTMRTFAPSRARPNSGSLAARPSQYARSEFDRERGHE
jgi:hypothetical protein